MVNGRLIVAVAVFAVDRLRIEYALSGNERQPRAARLARHYRAIEARPPAGVARRPARLIDPQPDRVLIAIDPDLAHALHVTRRLTFAPQRFARAAEIPGLAARD